MTTTQGAVAGVRDVLFESDQDLYVYAPPGEAHFIAEAALVGAAGFLLSAFFRGAKAVAEKRLEEWGTSLANWLFDRMRGLFGADQPEEGEELAEAAAAEAKAAVQANPSTFTSEAASEIETTIRDTLVSQNVPMARAEAIASAVARLGASVIQG